MISAAFKALASARASLAEDAGMDYSDRLQQALAYAKMSRKQLQEAVGITVQAVGQVINRQSNGLSAANNSRVARALGVSPDWLATGEGEMTGNPASTGSRFEPLSFDDLPLTREQIMSMGELPARFTYALEDDAMGEFGRAGTHVVFHTGSEAKMGAGVLVRDREGQLHVRRKAQGRSQAHWLAVAPNGVYRTLDSEADGLELLAVWRGVVNRGLEDA